MNNIERRMPPELSEEQKLDIATKTGNPFYGMEDGPSTNDGIEDMTDEVQEDQSLKEQLRQSRLITKGLEKNNPFYGMEGNEGHEAEVQNDQIIEEEDVEPKKKAA